MLVVTVSTHIATPFSSQSLSETHAFSAPWYHFSRSFPLNEFTAVDMLREINLQRKEQAGKQAEFIIECKMKETLKCKSNKIVIHRKSMLLGPARKPFFSFFFQFLSSMLWMNHICILVSGAHSFISYLNDLLSAAMLPFLLIKHKWGNWVRCCLTAREGTLQKPSWKERQNL